MSARFIYPDSIDAREGRYGSADFDYFVTVGVNGTALGRIYNMSQSAIFHTWLPAYRDWKEKQKDDRHNTTNDTAPLVG